MYSTYQAFQTKKVYTQLVSTTLEAAIVTSFASLINAFIVRILLEA